MHIILDWNKKLASTIANVIAQYIRGPLGIAVYTIILAFIFGIIGFVVNWLIHILITSLFWLIPIIITVLLLILLVYLVIKSSNVFK